jgi:hypothetical protein
METAGIQTGMAPREQDGEETNNYDDLMQAQRSIYRQSPDLPTLISIIFGRAKASLRTDAFSS